MAPLWAQASAAVAATKNKTAAPAASREPVTLRNQRDTFKIPSRQIHSYMILNPEAAEKLYGMFQYPRPIHRKPGVSPKDGRDQATSGGEPDLAASTNYVRAGAAAFFLVSADGLRHHCRNIPVAQFDRWSIHANAVFDSDFRVARDPGTTLSSLLCSHCLEQRLITTDVDFRSFKPGPTVEILITHDWGSQIIPAVSRRRVWFQMEVVRSSVCK